MAQFDLANSFRIFAHSQVNVPQRFVRLWIFRVRRQDDFDLRLGLFVVTLECKAGRAETGGDASVLQVVVVAPSAY